ncbi:MAG TPA: type III pantothenate kinase [Saprospiraceae bacterium]|nr:type III pantothenate kinase [Saprospiraceae bacterium]
MVDHILYHLCIDIGNTRVKYGIFQSEELIDVTSTEIDKISDAIHELNESFNIGRMIVSSTRRDIPHCLREFGKNLPLYLELSHETPLPISLDYDTPETLGRDRIAGAVGAMSIYPGQAVIIVDAGTCITYDFLDQNSVFKGGNIAPGMRMRLQAMNSFTEKLPLAPFENQNEILGKSTIKALQNGAIQGTKFEIESFIMHMKQKFGALQVIFTGGDANNFVDFFYSKIFVVQNLVLIGLNKIINHNAN